MFGSDVTGRLLAAAGLWTAPALGAHCAEAFRAGSSNAGDDHRMCANSTASRDALLQG